MRPRPPGLNETRDERIDRKAGDLRHALIATRVVVSPDSTLDYDQLPEARKLKWRKLAVTYLEIFG